MPHHDHREIATAVAYQQLHAAASPAGSVRWQRPAPDKRCALAQQGQRCGATLLEAEVGRDFCPVSGVVLGQMVSDVATVCDGVSDSPLCGRIQRCAWFIDRHWIVFQMHPATAPGHHRCIKQHCRVHDVRLCLGTDSVTARREAEPLRLSERALWLVCGSVSAVWDGGGTGGHLAQSVQAGERSIGTVP